MRLLIRSVIFLAFLPIDAAGLAPTTAGLASITRRQEAVLDGAEWASLRRALRSEKYRSNNNDDEDKRDEDNYSNRNNAPCGRMTIVIGTSLDSDVRVVGIEAPAGDGTFASAVYKDSMAQVPQGIKDDVAISTLVASLTSVHCALLAGTNANPKVIVVGGNDLACFAARGLAANGAAVSLVSTGNPRLDDYRVSSVNPAVGELEIGFCDYVGRFDAMVDTVSDESGQAEAPMDDNDLIGRAFSGVLSLLQSRHGCYQYISTMTASQRIVRDNGIIFGPSKAKDHVNQMMKAYSANLIVPPEGFGATLQTLLNEGVTYSTQFEGSTIIRTWTLPIFWELASWPRDASGANIRFGFPVIDDIDLIAEEDDGFDEAEEETPGNTNPGSNPFIVEIEGVQGLSREVIEKERDCLLFLSAKYCRTCKTIGPAYTQFARAHQMDSIVFGKADTTDAVGKELGRTLGVNAVPLFVFFRKGQRFGKPLSVNKLPSKKLDLALDFLTTGVEWDGAAIDAVKEKKDTRK